VSLREGGLEGEAESKAASDTKEEIKELEKGDGISRTITQFQQGTGLQVLTHNIQSITALSVSLPPSSQTADLLRQTSPTLMKGGPSNMRC